MARGEKMVFVSANDHQEWLVRRPQSTNEANTAETDKRKMSCTKMNDVGWNFHEISAFTTSDGKFWR